ncbi:MAG: hypothetical protein AAF089_00730 [Bacteroidota bacterium]
MSSVCKLTRNGRTFGVQIQWEDTKLLQKNVGAGLPCSIEVPQQVVERLLVRDNLSGVR